MTVLGKCYLAALLVCSFVQAQAQTCNSTLATSQVTISVETPEKTQDHPDAICQLASSSVPIFLGATEGSPSISGNHEFSFVFGTQHESLAFDVCESDIERRLVIDSEFQSGEMLLIRLRMDGLREDVQIVPCTAATCFNCSTGIFFYINAATTFTLPKTGDVLIPPIPTTLPITFAPTSDPSPNPTLLPTTSPIQTTEACSSSRATSAFDIRVEVLGKVNGDSCISGSEGLTLIMESDEGSEGIVGGCSIESAVENTFADCSFLLCNSNLERYLIVRLDEINAPSDQGEYVLMRFGKSAAAVDCVDPGGEIPICIRTCANSDFFVIQPGHLYTFSVHNFGFTKFPTLSPTTQGPTFSPTSDKDDDQGFAPVSSAPSPIPATRSPSSFPTEKQLIPVRECSRRQIGIRKPLAFKV